jgi:hypothetical protein
VVPFVTALAAEVLVPVSYTVVDASLTVTFSPVGVDTVKPDADTPVTVPTDPPAAFLDRAFDPPPDPA